MILNWLKLKMVNKFKFIFLSLIACYTMHANAQVVNGVNIDELINKMTIEEKAGQMTQIDLGVIAVGDLCNLKNPQTLDMKKLSIALQKYKVGSILNVGCGSGTISLQNWRKILTTIHQNNKKLTKLNIPVIYGIDAIHGVNYTMGATLFPQQIGQAATWNPDLVKTANQISAYETRASGLPWNFSPVLDIGRQPLWSRFFETYGEDVFLAKEMTKAAIVGLQGDNIANQYKVAACMKHFIGYSYPLSGKDRTPAWISERELREYFLPTFQTAINTGAHTVMINSGEINGTPVHINHDIVTKLLRDELGFKGVAVTDWEDIYKLVTLHRVAANKKEAVKMAIDAGIDMSMTPNDYEFTELLIALVKEGKISEERINLSVKRILTLKANLGLFQQTLYPEKLYTNFGSTQHANAAYKTAVESVTLLKNSNNILPLKNKEKLFVCGPAANSLNYLNGAWTHTWQGVDTTYNTKNKLTIIKAIQNIHHNVIYSEGSTIDSLTLSESDIEKARTCDKIIICLAEKPSTEVVGNINDLSLSEAQIALIEKLYSTGKPIVLVCNFNRPLIISRVEPKASGILYAYLSGDEGGRAIADLLIGKQNPSGKLPFTYPRFVNNFTHYDHKTTEDLNVDFSMTAYNPQFDFAHGLSYTNFIYDTVWLENYNISSSDSFFVNIKISNKGALAGYETIAIFYNDLVASITPSVKKLCGFKKVWLEPNESKTIRVSISASELSFINKNLERIIEPGAFEIMVDHFKTTLHVK